MPGRRSNGEGSIYQSSDGRWRSALTVGTKPDGSPQRRYLSGRTQSEVRIKLQKLKASVEGGTAVDPSRETVSQHTQKWIDEHIGNRKEATTKALYQLCATKYIAPKLGHIHLQKLTADQVESFVHWLYETTDAPRMRQVAYAVLCRSLKHAVKLGKIARTPATSIEKPSHDQQQMRPFTHLETSAIIKATSGDRWHVAYVLGLACGMRIGEILGLEWKSVDLKRKRLTVSQQAAIINGRPTIKRPKTKSSTRTIELPDVAVRALKDHRAIMLREGNSASDTVIPAPEGGVASRTNFSARAWKPMLKRLGVDVRGFHNARHTYATLALTAGVPVHIVAKILGHDRPSTTHDIYSHVLEGQQSQSTAAINRLLG